GNVVVIVNVFLVGRFAPVKARFVAMDGVERPRATPRHEQKSPRGRQRQALVEAPAQLFGSQLGLTRREIEDIAIADVDALGYPEIEERVGVWPPQHRRDDPLVSE